jgi:hypothetical protein
MPQGVRAYSSSPPSTLPVDRLMRCTRVRQHTLWSHRPRLHAPTGHRRTNPARSGRFRDSDRRKLPCRKMARPAINRFDRPQKRTGHPIPGRPLIGCVYQCSPIAQAAGSDLNHAAAGRADHSDRAAAAADEPRDAAGPNAADDRLRAPTASAGRTEAHHDETLLSGIGRVTSRKSSMVAAATGPTGGKSQPAVKGLRRSPAAGSIGLQDRRPATAPDDFDSDAKPNPADRFCHLSPRRSIGSNGSGPSALRHHTRAPAAMV